MFNEPLDLAHSETYETRGEELDIYILIASSNFSKIRGTPRNSVGLDSSRVLMSVDCMASG